MGSAWIIKRRTKRAFRYRVEFRVGGRESQTRYGGSFKRKADADARKRWIIGELAAMRFPDIKALEALERVPPKRPPNLEDAFEAWLLTRIDVAEITRSSHRVFLSRIFTVAPELRSKPVDSLTLSDVIGIVTAMHRHPYARESIRNTRGALGMVLDHFGVVPNPARDSAVKLPKGSRRDIPPPLAEHVELIAAAIEHVYVLPLLIIDATGTRVGALETTTVADFDEDRRAIRVIGKNERQGFLELPDELFCAIVCRLPARNDRDLSAPLFPGLTAVKLRKAIRAAIAVTGTPRFTPHGLRRRRGSLHYKLTGSLAEAAELLGDSKRVAAEHYIYAMTDYREIDRTAALARVRGVPTSVPTPSE